MTFDTPHNEVALVAGLRAGEDQAFTGIYRQLYRRVYWFAKRFLPSDADAQDLTADTFVQLWNKKEQFSSIDEIAAFLHVTVRNKCLNLLKRSQMIAGKQPELLHLLEEQHDGGDFYLEQVRIDLMRRIFTEVDKLPPRMREVFMLSYQDGLKPSEIAERLGIRVQTVTNQRVSAIRILQAALSKEPLLIAMLILLELEGLAHH